MNELQRLKQMTDSLKKESSSIMKKQILKNYSDLKPLLKIIYDPLYIFNITGDNVKKYYEEMNEHNKITPYASIYELLYSLHKRWMTGNEALSECICFWTTSNELFDFDLFCDVLNKDLKCGISVKTINSVFKNLIPEFNVPLAKFYEEKLCDFEKETWYASRKLDGVRCLCFIKKDNIEFYSRNGIRFETLNNLTSFITDFYLGELEIVLDGEICITDNDGNENFKKVITEIRRKNHQIKNPKFFVFDWYTLDDFLKGKITSEIQSLPIKNNKKVSSLDQIKIENKSHLEELMENINPKWEGLILRKNPTQFKRSNNLLKIKNFKEIDLKVKDIELSQKLIDNVPKVCVGSLITEYKNNILKIGSGLTDQDRINYRNHPANIIGKTITVKYFEETKDKNGEHSLRFPIFKGVRNYE